MNPLVKLFANPSLVAILELFLLNPEEEFYQAEVVNKTNYALVQVQRALQVLQKIGLIFSVKQGRMVYYKAVRSHPAFEDLKSLFLKTLSIAEGIRNSLLQISNKIQFAFIFGSIAKGNESYDSDIDLFLISDVGLRELSKILSPLSQKLHRELNPVIFSNHEFKNRISKKEHFVVELLSTPKLWVIGNENDFAQHRSEF